MNEYPLTKFYFQADWGGTKIGFHEISGLDIEVEMIEYRHGSSPEFSKIKMPGMKKYSNITLKRGSFQGDNEYFDWLQTIQLNTVERRTITISLLNQDGEPTITWKINNAFPVKLMSTDLKAEGNEIAVESIEIAHEGLSIENN